MKHGITEKNFENEARTVERLIKFSQQCKDEEKEVRIC